MEMLAIGRIFTSGINILFFDLLVHLYKLQFEDENKMKQENDYFFTLTYYSITAWFQITADLLFDNSKPIIFAMWRIFCYGITIPFLWLSATVPFLFFVATNSPITTR